MNFKILFWIVLVLIFIALPFSIGSEKIINEGDEGIMLSEGKNNVVFNSSLYVSNLVVQNPDIEYVSYIDEYNQTVGYVNIFSGIGKNFYIGPGQVYEINVKKAIQLQIK